MTRKRGVGPVHMMMFMGFIMGLSLAITKSSGGNVLVEAVGITCFFMGMLGMVGRTPIKGPVGGLLTGFGLGATLASYS